MRIRHLAIGEISPDAIQIPSSDSIKVISERGNSCHGDFFSLLEQNSKKRLLFSQFGKWLKVKEILLRLLGLIFLDNFKKKHPTARKTIDAWIVEVRTANWITPHSIKDKYRSADFLIDNRVIFNIKGNSFRLVARVSYEQQVVVVEWVGTHAEYDKKKF